MSGGEFGLVLLCWLYSEKAMLLLWHAYAALNTAFAEKLSLREKREKPPLFSHYHCLRHACAFIMPVYMPATMPREISMASNILSCNRLEQKEVEEMLCQKITSWEEADKTSSLYEKKCCLKTFCWKQKQCIYTLKMHDRLSLYMGCKTCHQQRSEPRQHFCAYSLSS